MKMHEASFYRFKDDCLQALASDLTVNDVHTMREAWDVLAAARGYWLYEEGLNDAHIETALRRIFPNIRKA